MIDENLICKSVIELWREAGKKCRREVSGTSMMPIIRDGNKVIIVYTHPKNIKLGDLIVFRSFENIVTHRVIGMHYIKCHKFFIEKGDFFFNSSIVAEEDVIGKVIAIENTDGIIDLDNRLWRLVSYTIVLYTHLTHPLVKGLQFAKRNLIRDTKKRFINLISKALFISLCLFPILIINIYKLYDKLSIKLKIKPNGKNKNVL